VLITHHCGRGHTERFKETKVRECYFGSSMRHTMLEIAGSIHTTPDSVLWKCPWRGGRQIVTLLGRNAWEDHHRALLMGLTPPSLDHVSILSVSCIQALRVGGESVVALSTTASAPSYPQTASKGSQTGVYALLARNTAR